MQLETVPKNLLLEFCCFLIPFYFGYRELMFSPVTKDFNWIGLQNAEL